MLKIFNKRIKYENVIYYLTDNVLPPIVRDNKFLMKILFRIIYGKKYKLFFTFKEKAYDLSNEEFAKIYTEIDLYQKDTYISSIIQKKNYISYSRVNYIRCWLRKWLFV